MSGSIATIDPATPKIPDELWRQSGRPVNAWLIRAWTAIVLITAAYFLAEVVGVYGWGLAALGVVSFFAIPVLADKLVFERLAARVDAVERSSANALLDELRANTTVRLLAPHAWLRVQEGKLLLAVDDGRGAARAFAEAARVSTHPGDKPELLSAQAHAHALAGDRKEARELLAKLAKLDALSPLDHLNFGVVLLSESGHNSDALAHIEEAREAFGDQPRVLAGLVLALQRCDRAQEAAALLEAAEAAVAGTSDVLAQDLLKRGKKGLRAYLKGKGKWKGKAKGAGAGASASAGQGKGKGKAKGKKGRKQARRDARKKAKAEARRGVAVDAPAADAGEATRRDEAGDAIAKDEALEREGEDTEDRAEGAIVAGEADGEEESRKDDASAEDDADGEDASDADADEDDASAEEKADGEEADGEDADEDEVDADGEDAGEADASEADAGEADAGEADAGEADAGEADAGEADASESDADSEEASSKEDADKADPSVDAKHDAPSTVEPSSSEDFDLASLARSALNAGASPKEPIRDSASSSGIRPIGSGSSASMFRSALFSGESDEPASATKKEAPTSLFALPNFGDVPKFAPPPKPKRGPLLPPKPAAKEPAAKEPSVKAPSVKAPKLGAVAPPSIPGAAPKPTPAPKLDDGWGDLSGLGLDSPAAPTPAKPDEDK